MSLMTGPAAGFDLNPFDSCNNTDAPVPAAPAGIQVGPDSTGNPFNDPGVTFQSTYGDTPQWTTYDDGCFGQMLASAGTSIGNIEMDLSGALPNWVTALMHAVVNPGGWIGAIDTPIAHATRAVTEGIWRPWAAIGFLLVAVLLLTRLRGGRISGAITAAGWALGVLLVVSWMTKSEAIAVSASALKCRIMATAWKCWAAQKPRRWWIQAVFTCR